MSCDSCKRDLPAGQSAGLCPACIEVAGRNRKTACVKCGRPKRVGSQNGLCSYCEQAKLQEGAAYDKLFPSKATPGA